MAALIDWSGAETVLLLLTLIATIHLANRQNRSQVLKEAGVINGLSLLMLRWSSTLGVCAALVSVEGDDSDTRKELDAIWAEIQRIDALTLPHGSAISALIEIRAIAERALHPPTLGEVLPSQRVHWETALMDARDLSLYWHEVLKDAAKEHASPWPRLASLRRSLPARPEARLAKSAKALAERFRAMEAAKAGES